MAASSTFPAEACSTLSYDEALWQMSWGETDVIAALKEEASRTCTPQQINAQAVSASSYQLPAFQPVAFVMTRIPGMPCQLPAVLFSAQPEQPSTTRTSLVANSRAFVPGNFQANNAGPLASTDNENACFDQAVTRENFEGELPSIGSEAHFDGSCKRCAFFPKGRCTNGKDCTHCHFPHEPRSRLRKRTLKAQKGGCQEENAMLENAYTEMATTGAPDGFDALSEVLLYLSEPVATSSPQETKHHHVSACPEPPTPCSEDTSVNAIMEKFNNALLEVAETYMDSATENKGKDFHNDSIDVDTTPSVSALSDGEDTSTMSKSSAPSETSDSEPALAAPTSWLSMQRSRKGAKQQSSTSVEIARMTRSLLNKLTEQRFESLCAQIVALPFSTPEQLAVVVAEIFQKATTQDGFRSLYTELCIRLDAHLAPQSSSIGGKAFRKALVNECQATFERNLQPPDESVFAGLDSDDCFEVEMKLKTRRLGNMRFIGDLLVRKLLAPKLLPPIVHELLNGDEAALESLIALLAVVSPKFETKTSLYQAPLRDALAVLRRKMDDKSVCSRLGCQINDLLDAKARGWAPRATAC